MKVLFWNTKKNKNINRTLRDLICENGISLVVLAEYNADIEQLKRLLIENGVHMNIYSELGSGRITILGTKINISPGIQTDYYSFQIVNGKDIYCCIHLPSQLYTSNNGRRELKIQEIMTDIKTTEKEIHSENTIIVGDLNMNPFENACIDAGYFHSIPIFEETKNKRRTICGVKYGMFYNPMWRFFGDEKPPYGTYYYSGGNTNEIFWHIFDQVIIRPSLKERFISSSLQIITETRRQYLLNDKGKPDENISDHLPIIFEIQEEK